MASGWLGFDWGNVPVWVGTVVTSTSVTIAALSYRRSILDKERGQASFVAAWVGLVKRDGEHHRVVQVSNGSEASVYEIAIRLTGDRNSFLPEVPELPAKTTTSIELGPADQGRSGAPVFDMNAWVVRFLLIQETVSAASSPELEFRDAAGRMWRRATDGRLTPLRQRTITYIDSPTRSFWRT